ncbi:MAG: protein kinase [Deltaproteobacteria bacterium]|nr:protein kinase [Deltaproteobacteria bacterium]
MTSNAQPALHPGFADLRGEVFLDRFAVSTIEQAGPYQAVFGAFDRQTDAHVLLRILLPPHAYQDEIWERFGRRIRAARRVRHPNVRRPHDSGESHDGTLFVVCRRPGGLPMPQWLAGQPDGRVPWSHARLLLLQLASALQFAHARGVVHGTLRPEDCWVDAGVSPAHVHVLGLGACLGPAPHEREAAELVTTVMHHDVEFAAPEAAGGGLGDRRSDVYRLGLVAYYLLAGQAPYRGDNPFQVAAQHATASIPVVSETIPGVPTAVDTLLARLLAKNPQDRLASMDEVMAALGDPAVLTAWADARPVPSRAPSSDDELEEAPTTPMMQPGRFVSPPQGAYEETQLLAIDETGGAQRPGAAPGPQLPAGAWSPPHRTAAPARPSAPGFPRAAAVARRWEAPAAHQPVANSPLPQPRAAMQPAAGPGFGRPTGRPAAAAPGWHQAAPGPSSVAHQAVSPAYVPPATAYSSAGVAHGVASVGQPSAGPAPGVAGAAHHHHAAYGAVRHHQVPHHPAHGGASSPGSQPAGYPSRGAGHPWAAAAHAPGYPMGGGGPSQAQAPAQAPAPVAAAYSVGGSVQPRAGAYSGGGPAQAAYSAGSPVQPHAAAYSGASPAQAAAYSGASPAQAAACSGASPAQAAAYSAAGPAQAAAYSASSPAQAAAYSGASPAQAAAYSGASPAQAAAYSGASPAQAAAYSGASPAQAAYSGSGSAYSPVPGAYHAAAVHPWEQPSAQGPFGAVPHRPLAAYRPPRPYAAQPWPVLPPPSAFLNRSAPGLHMQGHGSAAAISGPSFRVATWLLAWSLLVASSVLAVGVWLHI